MHEQPVSISASKVVSLPRPCIVTIVPAGHQVSLPEGTRVTLLQALGGTATVTTPEGEMARLAADDAVELGFIASTQAATTASAEPFTIERAWEAATNVYDPEIPVNIVELGLVYRVDAQQLPSGRWRVDVDMSVTAPFCGMGDVLRQDLHDAIAVLPGVEWVEVSLVFDPPWNVSRMSDVARLELGMM
jgi:probable FeS assembly SUF system protein SufT